MSIGRYRIANCLEDEHWALMVRLAVPGYCRVTMTSCLTCDMLMKWIYHSCVSSVVDSSDFPVSLLKEMKLSSPRKYSYKVNVNFHRRSLLYLSQLSRLIIETYFLNKIYGDISTMVVDIKVSYGEKLDIIFVYLLMLHVC